MAEKEVPKHGTGSNRALQLLYRVNTLPLQDLDSVCSSFCASKEDVLKGLPIPGTAEAPELVHASIDPLTHSLQV